MTVRLIGLIALAALGATAVRQYTPVPVDQKLLRSYFAAVYEIPTETGTVRVSVDGDAAPDDAALPDVLRRPMAILTAYNPRSMLLPRRVNEGRLQVMRDLLIYGCYRVEHCVGFDEDPDGVWREPALLVHGIEREEAVSFGRVFRQNTILYCRNGRPELIVTDPTCDPLGKTYQGNWRIRS